MDRDHLKGLGRVEISGFGHQKVVCDLADSGLGGMLETGAKLQVKRGIRGQQEEAAGYREFGGKQQPRNWAVIGRVKRRPFQNEGDEHV